MRENPVQFAVVREDPLVDIAVVERTAARRALLPASGGCTAFELARRFPQIEITLIDPNPAQLALVQEKLQLLSGPAGAARHAKFNVGSDAPRGLNQRGNFESLFRQLRLFLEEFVVSREELVCWFEGGTAEETRRWFSSRYWAVAFRLFFSDALLEAMFTNSATQHADPGSYPQYFRSAFERGLLRADARMNYFLHHVFLGRYLAMPGAYPSYVDADLSGARVTLVQAGLEEISDFSPYDFVGLSNVLDWMPRERSMAILKRLRSTLRPGAAVLWRQLNNEVRHEEALLPEILLDGSLSPALLARDRSLFYNRVCAGFRT
ncbi:MAG: DUF3419 family protein [Planctomycetes bacterium]|nr:DUF3419 family protein [Planctomycetota bacterium]